MADFDLFEEDELMLRSVDPDWSVETLLSQDGLFYLKDLVEPLGLDSSVLIRKARARWGLTPTAYERYGMGKLFGHWIVRMRTFAESYRHYGYVRISHVHPDWDSEEMLAQDGCFPLTEVSRLVPLSSRQLRHLAQKGDKPRSDYGLWREPSLKKFLVDMPVFAKWLKETWSNDDEL